MPDLAFAYRLAAKLGVADVGGLVDSLTPAQWDGWIASAILDGWYNSWSKTAELLAQMNNTTNRLELMQSANPRALQDRQIWKSGAEIANQLTDFTPKKRKPLDSAGLVKRLERFERAKNGNHKQR